jgi:DNA polymerase elongation subunit (family B)
MKTQKELKELLAKKVEEINLSQQVELAVDYAKYKKDAAAIKAAIKSVTAFEHDIAPLDNIPEIVVAINSLKAFEKKVANA